MINHYNFGRILSSFIMAMALRIAPWPDIIATINPDWVLLVLIYWTLAVPERVGIFHAWTFGLLTDVLTGRLFGQHALAYSLISYVCLKLHKRLRPFPLIQQELFIFLFLLTSQLLIFWIKSLQNPDQLSATFWLPVVTGTLCWPIVYKSLRFVRLLRSTK
jgi:rod shape-determining protein MreD